MKKLLALLMLVAMAVGFLGCERTREMTPEERSDYLRSARQSTFGGREKAEARSKTAAQGETAQKKPAEEAATMPEPAQETEEDKSQTSQETQ